MGYFPHFSKYFIIELVVCNSAVFTCYSGIVHLNRDSLRRVYSFPKLTVNQYCSENGSLVGGTRLTCS